MKPSHPFSFLHQQRNAAHLFVMWPQFCHRATLTHMYVHGLCAYCGYKSDLAKWCVNMASRGSWVGQHASHCPLPLSCCSITGVRVFLNSVRYVCGWVCLHGGQEGWLPHTHPHRCIGLCKWQPGPEDVCWLLARARVPACLSSLLLSSPPASCRQPATACR